MTLVTSEDRNSPRIMPKVFSDVPSQAEIENAKSQSARLLATTIFLGGLLVAAALVSIFLLFDNSRLRAEPAGLKAQLEKSGGAAKALEAQLATEQKRHAEEMLAVQRERDEVSQAYFEVETRRREAQEVRDRIAALLTDSKKGAENDPRVRRVLAAYLGQPKWEQVSRAAIPQLEAEIKALETGEKAVKSWVRPVTRPRETGVSPFPR